MAEQWTGTRKRTRTFFYIEPKEYKKNKMVNRKIVHRPGTMEYFCFWLKCLTDYNDNLKKKKQNLVRERIL